MMSPAACRQSRVPIRRIVWFQINSKKGKLLAGPNPDDHSKSSKRNVPSDAQGFPLTVAISGTNMHDIFSLSDSSAAHPPSFHYGPRQGRPVRLRAGKAHFSIERLT
ncbi:hypothetical protein [Streptomyces formicae]|uniref:Uncharacterized protein n=1 Tax=Streptomyces formicae TaxID=1616117 RepID=A0A291Q272_9ACTN|nr:hypothetical protein [Streptomyces formicae]ATL25597.1 hypothetical protein KY5_0579 [Streptomyces formicae]